MCALFAWARGHRENTQGVEPRLLSAGLLRREVSIEPKEPGTETVFVRAAARTLLLSSRRPGTIWHKVGTRYIFAE